MIRVLVVSELGLLSGALRAVLALEDDLAVAELGVGPDLVPAARGLHPDILLVDVGTGDEPGLRLARDLAEQLPDSAVVILASRRVPGLLRQALDSRVRGFASMDQPPKVLAEYLRRVAAREWLIDPAITDAGTRTGGSPLTVRETEVLRLAAQGRPTRVIARQLYLAEGTVRNHVSAILRKTGARNRLEAIRWAEEAGWI